MLRFRILQMCLPKQRNPGPQEVGVLWMRCTWLGTPAEFPEESDPRKDRVGGCAIALLMFLAHALPYLQGGVVRQLHATLVKPLNRDGNAL